MLRATIGAALRAAMPAFVVFVLLVPVQGRAAEFIIEPLDYDIPSEVAAAAEQGKTLVIMFGQNGCPYCEKMHKRVLPHPEVVAQYGTHFVLFEINIKGDLEVTAPDGTATTEKLYAAEMRARATPLFVYYDKNGRDVLRLTGYQEPGIFMTAGRYVSSGAYQDGTTFLNFVRSGK